MNFTSKEFNEFRSDFEKAVAPVAEKYALAITSGVITYTQDTFSMKVECVKTDAGDVKQKAFINCCALYGLTENDYMREFAYQGKKYVFTELVPGRSKYPCVCREVSSNKDYKMTLELVKQELHR